LSFEERGDFEGAVDFGMLKAKLTLGFADTTLRVARVFLVQSAPILSPVSSTHSATRFDRTSAVLFSPVDVFSDFPPCRETDRGQARQKESGPLREGTGRQWCYVFEKSIPHCPPLPFAAKSQVSISSNNLMAIEGP